MIPHTMSRYCGCVECDPDNLEREGETMCEQCGCNACDYERQPIAPELAAMHVETIPPETFEEKDPFDFIDNLLESFTEDQLLLLENRIFSAIVRKRESE